MRTRISDEKGPFIDDTHRAKFLAACHRGFEKAQNQLVSLLEQAKQDADEEERKWAQLVLRKIADSIACQMVQFQTHVMRRFCLHDVAQGVDLKTVELALPEANRLNAESRMTFALLADLTTFIHVADILRVDFRNGYKFSLIELKTGRINELLLSALKEYEPDPKSLEKIKSDARIGQRHQKQAARMLNQQIRVFRADEVIKTDEGTDPQRGVPIRHTGPMVYIKHFDAIIAEVCKDARFHGVGAATVNFCMYIGAGFSENLKAAKGLAFDGIHAALSEGTKNLPPGFDRIQSEVIAAVGADRDNNFTIVDLVANNLHSIATRPFLMWEIERKHILTMISRNLWLLAVFDLQKFFWLARKEGAQLRFASRAETENAKSKIGSINIFTRGHRGILYKCGNEELFLTTGLFSRMINDLMSPLQLIRTMLVPNESLTAELESWKNQVDKK